MLNHARGVLRSRRLPGAPCENDRELDAQAEAASRPALAATGGSASSAAPPPDPAVEALLSELALCDPSGAQEPSERQRLYEKLRRDVQKIERANSRRRQECEELLLDAANRAVRRFEECDRQQTAEGALARGKRDLREARDMVRIQEREIKELRELRVALEEEASAKPRTPPAKQQAAPGAAAPGAARARHRGGGGLSGEEVRGALLQDELGEPDETRIKAFLNNENQKFISVIDAVGELSRQLHAPRGAGDAPPKAPACGGGEGAAPSAAGPRPPPNGARRPLGPPPTGLALRREREKEWASYSSVLNDRPSNQMLRLFMC